MKKEEFIKLKEGDIVTIEGHDGEFQILEANYLGSDNAQVFCARPENLENRTFFGLQHLEIVTMKKAAKAQEPPKAPAKKEPEVK